MLRWGTIGLQDCFACHDLTLKLAAQPYVALKMTKITVNEGINVNLKTGFEIEARCFELLFSTKDQKEEINTFLAKRKPKFQRRVNRLSLLECTG